MEARAIAGILMGTVALAVGCGDSGGPDTSTPEGVTESFFEALSSGDDKKACSFVPKDSQVAEVLDPITEGERETSAANAGCEETLSGLSEDRRKLYESPDVGKSSKRKVGIRKEELRGLAVKFETVTVSVLLAKAGSKWQLDQTFVK